MSALFLAFLKQDCIHSEPVEFGAALINSSRIVVRQSDLHAHLCGHVAKDILHRSACIYYLLLYSYCMPFDQRCQMEDNTDCDEDNNAYTTNDSKSGWTLTSELSIAAFDMACVCQFNEDTPFYIVHDSACLYCAHACAISQFRSCKSKNRRLAEIVIGNMQIRAPETQCREMLPWWKKCGKFWSCC